MTKSPSWVLLLLFVVSGCAMLTDEPVAPFASNSEIQYGSDESEKPLSATSVIDNPLGGNDRMRTQAGEFDREEVQEVQTILKTAGFDPGEIDGEFGPKTKRALLRLQAGCIALDDLLGGGELEKMAPTSGSLRSGDRDFGTKLGNEQIRVIQVRLKDAGFDPGEIDGIVGPKTRTAVARFRSGCQSFNAMPAAVVEIAESTEQISIRGISGAGNAIRAHAAPGGRGEFGSGQENRIGRE